MERLEKVGNIGKGVVKVRLLDLDGRRKEVESYCKQKGLFWDPVEDYTVASKCILASHTITTSLFSAWSQRCDKDGQGRDERCDRRDERSYQGCEARR